MRERIVAEDRRADDAVDDLRDQHPLR